MAEQDKQKQTQNTQTQKPGGGKDGVQGEGDYDAARRYDKEQEEFAKSGRVEDEARKRVEEEAREHPKGKGK